MVLKKNIPNFLSIIRIPLGILFLFLFLEQTTLSLTLSLLIILISTITDFLDGEIARKKSWVTPFGKIIDPLCDFLFFFFIFLGLYLVNLIPAIVLAIFLAREISMYTIIRPIAARKKLNTAAKLPGKIKTAFQFFASIFSIILLILQKAEIVNFNMQIIITSLFVISVSISVASLYSYVKPLIKASNFTF